MKLDDIGWRKVLLNLLTEGEIYCFGVYTGTSLKEILHLAQERRIKIPKIYGLDTYTGLPTGDIESQDCWTQGAFSSLDHFKVATPEEAVEKVKNFLSAYLTYTRFIAIISEYKNLTTEQAEWYCMRPASYIDLDCDLYSSSYEALDFMCKNKLIKEGTIIGCDDFGGSKNWWTFEDGQSKAILDISLKYKLNLEPLFQLGTTHPHIHTAFRVI